MAGLVVAVADLVTRDGLLQAVLIGIAVLLALRLVLWFGTRRVTA